MHNKSQKRFSISYVEAGRIHSTIATGINELEAIKSLERSHPDCTVYYIEYISR